MAADEMYPLLNRDNLPIPIHIQLCRNQKTFSQLLVAFLKSKLIFKYFEKKDDPHRFCILEIKDSEKVIRKISKKPRFRGPFHKQHGKGGEALLKYASQNYYDIHWSLPTQFRRKKSLLLTCKILGLYVNALAVDEKYLLLNRDNLTIHIQMQLSQKEKTFSEFFCVFWKSRLNLKSFKKKDGAHRFCIFEITDSENVVR